MWDTRKLILAAVVFTVFDCKVAARTIELLDPARDAVDDQYYGCREEAMEKFIKSGLLTQELDLNPGFKKAWSHNTCMKQIPGGTKEHTTALSAFTNGDRDFIDSFHKAVKTMGINATTYESSFNFKSLHFLLMDAISLSQKQKTERCKTFYLTGNVKITGKLGTKVRFGAFTKVFTSYTELMDMTDIDGQVFNITSCFFVNLDNNNICHGEANAVLLSPAEEFTLMNLTKAKEVESDNEFTAIVLAAPHMISYHNCYTFSRSSAGVSTRWLVLVFAVVPFFT